MLSVMVDLVKDGEQLNSTTHINAGRKSLLGKLELEVKLVDPDI